MDEDLKNKIIEITDIKPGDKAYFIKVSDVDDKLRERRLNIGFNPYELMGILEHIQLEILEQMAGKIKPDEIKRTLIQ